MLDDITISKAITENFMKDFLKAMEVDVAIGGAGPAGMTTAYYLAKEGMRTVIFERSLRPGGGMPGGGMMFNTISSLNISTKTKNNSENYQKRLLHNLQEKQNQKRQGVKQQHT